MPTFAYIARDISGRAVNGTLTGTDERAIREQLRRSNLYVTKMEVHGSSKAAGSQSSLFGGRVKLYDLVVFSRQLSTLVRAGLQLTEALDILAQQTRNETLRAAIKEMYQDIASGSTMSSTMKKHPKLFSELYVSLVEAGETGGLLDQTLDTAAIALDTEMEIREKVRSAFVYPIAVVITAIGVVTFLLAYVVPIFASVYSQFHAELPAITKILVFISACLKSYWWVGVLALTGTVYACSRIYRTYRGRRFFDRLKTRVPLFGHLIEKIGLARTSHTLAALTNAGVPLTRALGTAGRVSGNALVMDAMDEVNLQIQNGTAMGVAMADTRRFPLIMTRMIAAGEQSGNLGEMLEQVARFFDREVDYGVKRLLTMIEPILTIVLGFVVGFILLALYYPIFNLGNVVK